MQTSGQRLKYFVHKMNISRQTLSKTLGISIGCISMYCLDKSGIRKTIALAIEACYGLNHQWLLHGKRPMYLMEKKQGITSTKEREILLRYKNLNKKQKELTDAFLKALAQSQDIR